MGFETFPRTKLVRILRCPSSLRGCIQKSIQIYLLRNLLFSLSEQSNYKWSFHIPQNLVPTKWSRNKLAILDIKWNQKKNLIKWHLSYTVYTCADGSVKFQTPTTVLVSGSPMKVPSQATWTWAGLNPVFMHSTYSIPYTGIKAHSFLQYEKTVLSTKSLEKYVYT